LSDITIRVDGDMGIITGVRHSKGIDNDGKPVDSKARFSRTLVKRDGKWMRIAATDVGIKAE
ncbi:MAG: nuclear transport factor 2 family protein, partial [Acidobacteriota bacterium]|nr:nuclear transport factor 2 family protein [Acidobacteriota bacterium]